MIPRSRFVRIFKRDRCYYCILCDELVSRLTQRECPPFLRDNYHSCLCRYNPNNLIEYQSDKGQLFNNETDEIISTLYECNVYHKQRCSMNCNNCNFTSMRQQLGGVEP